MKSMPIQLILLLLLLLLFAAQSASQYPPDLHLFSSYEPWRKGSHRLSKPLVLDDGRVYTCSGRNLIAFESNGSVAWTVNLNYECNVGIAPVNGGSRKIYLVAEKRVLRVNSSNIGTSESAVDIFFGPQRGREGDGIVGLSVSMLSSTMFINVKNRGLFAYRLDGQMVWSAGPVLYQPGFRQGCRKNEKDCFFASKPMIDECEASIYISNTEGELYALSMHGPHFKWIQDISFLDKSFTVTPGNNGFLYVTVPVKALVLALDVTTGTILWQRRIGPLSTADCSPVVHSNGWISIGSSDGVLYSFSPTGVMKKFSKSAALDSVVQASPLLDCSGYAVYISQTQMEGKISHTTGEYTCISAMKPRTVVFTLLVPKTGSICWSESYPGASGQLSALSESDLRHFVLDERILLAFIAASKIGNQLPCRSSRQKLASSCSLADPKRVSIYTGNEKAVLLFLLLESAILIVLVIVVRFCCVFWRKKKLQDQDLGKFLEKRRSLQLQKKAFDRTITELEQKAAEEATANEVIEKLGDLVKEKEGIERKLSTTYSLGSDRTGSKPKSLLPLYDGKTSSYSFQGAKKETVTVFHTLSDTSSADASSEKEAEPNYFEDNESAGKAKATIRVSSPNHYEIKKDYEETPSTSASSSKGFMSPLFVERTIDKPKGVKMGEEGEVRKTMQRGNSSMRRRTLSFN